VEGVTNVWAVVFDHFFQSFKLDFVCQPFKTLSTLESGDLTRPLSEEEVKQAG